MSFLLGVTIRTMNRTTKGSPDGRPASQDILEYFVLSAARIPMAIPPT